MKAQADILEALGILIDSVKDARQDAREIGAVNVLRELDRCAEAAASARRWALKSLSQGVS